MKTFFTLALLSVAFPLQAANRYFVVMFGYDDKPATLRHAHTFVDFVATGDNGEVADQAVLSWLPARDGGREVQPLGKPEAAVNADLATTLDLAAKNQRTVSYWEPLEVDVDLFNLAKTRVSALATSKSQFLLYDRDTSTNLAAVSDVSAANVMEARGFGFLSGPRASRALLEWFGPYLLDEHATHPELLAKIKVGTGTLADALSAAKAEVQDVWNLQVRRH